MDMDYDFDENRAFFMAWHDTYHGMVAWYDMRDER